MLLLLLNGEPQKLRIEYSTDDLISGSDVGEMLEEIDQAFRRYVRRNNRRSDLALAVSKVEVSSLIADLVIVTAGASMTLAQNPELLSGFLSNLANLLAICQDLGTGAVGAKDRKLIKVLQAPIAKKHATQINIFINGDSNAVRIDDDIIDGIARAENRRSHDLSALPNDGLSQSVEGKYVEPEIPQLRWLKGTVGTAVRVKSNWYVRLEGEGGVLNPVSNGGAIDLEDERAYNFDGVWEGRSYLIERATPLGK
jgi:hypothetical protein